MWDSAWWWLVTESSRGPSVKSELDIHTHRARELMWVIWYIASFGCSHFFHYHFVFNVFVNCPHRYQSSRNSLFWCSRVSGAQRTPKVIITNRGRFFFCLLTCAINKIINLMYHMLWSQNRILPSTIPVPRQRPRSGSMCEPRRRWWKVHTKAK